MNELLGHNLFCNYPMAAYVYIMICCFRLDVVGLPWSKSDDNSKFPYEDHFGPESSCLLLNEAMYKRNNLRLTSLGQVKVKIGFMMFLVLLL